ncbi:MAG: Holliday junction resolvase RuvX [Defluviitaleaceae bacterium]|nr:Holliday junction resolvase RuvX [Defluviitaleaceae bacterium]
MCLDYGDKRIGVAVSDPLGITAQAITVIRRDNETAVKPVLRSLAELISEYDVGEIILGYPRNMDGSEGFRCEKTREFKARLERRFNIPVILWDERLSTVGADRGLAHLTKKKRDAVIDQSAAVFILQGYLESKIPNYKGDV